VAHSLKYFEQFRSNSDNVFIELNFCIFIKRLPVKIKTLIRDQIFAKQYILHIPFEYKKGVAHVNVLLCRWKDESTPENAKHRFQVLPTENIKTNFSFFLDAQSP